MKQSVATVIFNDDNSQVLLVKRRDVPVWVLPGGGIDSGELPEEAAVREAWEETGLTVTIARKVCEYVPCNRLTFPTHLYICHIAAGKLTLSDETNDIQFFPLETAKQHLFIVHQEWLTDALANNPNLTHKEMNSVTYKALLRYFFQSPWQVIRFAFTLLLNKFR